MMTNRSDPLEARCREMALAAGMDPDGRIAKSGSKRGMPAWCTFVGAARAEATAHQAAELELPPQDAAYRNSPLTVIGDHTEATLTQMRSCMEVGNAVAGVICADGHLGYAQPVVRGDNLDGLERRSGWSTRGAAAGRA